MALFRRGLPVIDLIREGLSNPTERGLGLELAGLLSVDQRALLLDDLLDLARFDHSRLGRVRDLILSLPRESVKSRLEPVIGEAVANGDPDEVSRILELCTEVDRNLATRCAFQVALSSSEEVAEVGREFAQRLAIA